MSRPGSLAVSVTAWQGLTPRDKLIFKFCFDILALGEPAIYLDPTTKRWATFTHWDWNPLHVAVLGCLAGNVGDIPPGYEIPMDNGDIDRAQLKSDIVTFCENQGMVPPNPSMETWQDVLDAQDAPRAAILMGDAIPPRLDARRRRISMIYSFAIIALILGLMCYPIYRQRKKKASDTRSHHIVLLDGFPAVHIPSDVKQIRADRLATKIKYTYLKTWAQLKKVYGEDPGPMPIATIGTSKSGVSKEHPHILWVCPRDKMFLRIQPSMYYWLAKELHNIFRYLLHGIENIYAPVDEDDEKKIVAADSWISIRWKGNN